MIIRLTMSIQIALNLPIIIAKNTSKVNVIGHKMCPKLVHFSLETTLYWQPSQTPQTEGVDPADVTCTLGDLEWPRRMGARSLEVQ